MSRNFKNYRLHVRRKAQIFLVRFFGPITFRVLSSSWKVKRTGLENGPENKEEVVYALWHESIPAGVSLHRNKKLCVMISHHPDGEMIEKVAKRFGFLTARGSTTRGGAGGIRKMLQDASKSRGLVITPDGPQGPSHTIAPGLLFVAAVTGRPMLAVGFAASKAWRARRSWDKMIFPKPGAVVGVAYSKPFQVPRNVLEDEEQKNKAVAKLANAFEDAHAQAQALVQNEIS
ncbi:MAG: hypothetical protein CMJ96_02455 [Planctomycetes bacterium]|jgi:lysophospholipid acyltransferase (LPLAT)-like uncharacterized protein|nr:hypothetical protein [Planctomycetota bacterium]|tara:strand:+ start:1341 stop:2033 length:693 start_codon:yes stop_codon:yes gene_type:complete